MMHLFLSRFLKVHAKAVDACEKFCFANITENLAKFWKYKYKNVFIENVTLYLFLELKRRN